MSALCRDAALKTMTINMDAPFVSSILFLTVIALMLTNVLDLSPVLRRSGKEGAEADYAQDA